MIKPDRIKLMRNNLLVLIILIANIILGTSNLLAIPSFSDSSEIFDFYEDSSDVISFDFNKNIIRDSNDIDDRRINFKLLKVRKDSDPKNSIKEYNWVNLNNDGIMYVNSDHDTQSGKYFASIFASNKKSLGESRKFTFNVKKVNDKPFFTNVENKYQLAEDIDFLEYITAEDEEEHYPLVFNIEFLDNCEYRKDSSRKNCNLFEFVHVSDNSIKIEFTPTKDDIGNYYANITVEDSGKDFGCDEYCDIDYNQNMITYSEIVEFEVLSKADIAQNILFSPIENIQESNIQYELLLSGLISLVIFIFIFNKFKDSFEKFAHKLITGFEKNIGIKKEKQKVRNKKPNRKKKNQKEEKMKKNNKINKRKKGQIEKRSNKHFRLYSILLLIGIILIGFIGIVIAIPFFNNFGTTTYLNEDTIPIFVYNFSDDVTINLSDPDDNTLAYSILGINSSFYPTESNILFFNWFRLSPTSGLMDVDAIYDNQTGEYNLSVFVENEDNLGESRPFYFIINATNDAPIFTNLELEYNLTQNESFIEFINASDEENHFPLSFNISFLNNCTLASWSNRTDCNLFNLINIPNTSSTVGFTPQRNDVGIYYANVTVSDFGENYPCIDGYCDTNYQINQSTTFSPLVAFNVFSILSINATDCQNRVFQEGQVNTCEINVSTKGPGDFINVSSIAILRNYIGFVSNNSWFYNDNSTISNNFLSTHYVNLIPGKTEVGNWTINFTVDDITSNETLTEQIYIYVNRTNNDIPDIIDVSDVNTSIDSLTRINLTIYDDDFLIPDKNVSNGGYIENLTFILTTYNRSNPTQQILITGFDVEIINMPVSSTNRTDAKIEFNVNVSEAGDYIVNVSVRDLDGGVDETLFNLSIIANSAPVWNPLTDVNYILNEDGGFLLNLSSNVSDPNGDNLTFGFISENSFPSFTIDSLTGVISFTPDDSDIGEHIVNISANDGFLTSIIVLNFTVNNINDFVNIEKPILQIDVINATVDIQSNINASEDSNITIILWVNDDDFIIPINQKSFYNESLNLGLSIEGPNTGLFSFLDNLAFPIPGSDRVQYQANFLPIKSDVGTYNISISVTDSLGSNDALNFNLTIIESDHSPVMMNLSTQNSAVNRSFNYRINAYDIEDGNSTTLGNLNFSFSYEFMNGSDFINGNQNIFNNITGEFNISFSQGLAGYYRINITVIDSTLRIDSQDFILNVYDNPIINSPDSSTEFNLKEGALSNLSFNVDHSVSDNLTYIFYFDDGINRFIRYNISSYGNGSDFLWEFTPGFDEELTNGALTLATYTSNSDLLNRTDLNATMTWNLTINHTDDILSFFGQIGGTDSTLIGSSPQEVILSDFFNDEDAKDAKYNQTITFSYIEHNVSFGSILVQSTDWINGSTPFMNFTANIDSSTNFTILAFEHNISDFSHVLRNVSSNVFTVNISVVPVPVPTSGGGGGGGGGGSSSVVPRSYKIVAPSRITAVRDTEIEVEFQLVNEGNKYFNDIDLTSLGFKGLNGLRTSLDKDHFNSLAPGATEDFTLTIFFEDEVPLGKYDILLNATSSSPRYSDWAIMQIDLREIDITELKKYIIFADELVKDNYECREIIEITNEAFDNFDKGRYPESRIKAEEAIASCKSNISNFSLRDPIKSAFRIPIYVVIIVVALSIVTLATYIAKRILLQKKGKPNDEIKKIDI